MGHFRKHGGLNHKKVKGAILITNVYLETILAVSISIKMQQDKYLKGEEDFVSNSKSSSSIARNNLIVKQEIRKKLNDTDSPIPQSFYRTLLNILLQSIDSVHQNLFFLFHF